MDTLRDYIAYARATCFPSLTHDAAQELAHSYVEMRSMGMSRKVGGDSGAAGRRQVWGWGAASVVLTAAAAWWVTGEAIGWLLWPGFCSVARGWVLGRVPEIALRRGAMALCDPGWR